MQSALFIFILGVIPSPISALCRPPNIDFRKDEKYFYRRIPYIIEIDVDKCPGLPLLYFKWSLVHAGLTVRDRTYRDFLVHGYEHVPVDTAFTLETTLTVSVSHYANFSVYSEKVLNIEFVPEPFHLEIDGGKKRIIPPDTRITVDGLRLSYDPTFSREEDDLFKTYEAEWISNPEIDKFYLSTLMPDIPQGTLKENVTYNLTVTVTRDPTRLKKGFYYRKSVSQIIIVKKVKAIPVLKMECLYNCKVPNFMESVILEMNCLRNCDDVNEKWIWNFYPSTPRQSFEFGTGYNKLIINPHTYISDTHVLISASNGVNREFKRIIYGPSITNGNCFIKPEKGIGAVTIFKVTCEGYHSPSGIRRYAVYQMYDDKSIGILLHHGSKLVQQKMFLAPGSPAKLTVIIEDETFLMSFKEIRVEVRNPEVKLNDLKAIAFGRVSYSLYWYWEKNSRNEMVQTISFVMTAMKNISDVPVLEKKKILRYMVKYISFLEPRDFMSVLQWLSVFEKMYRFYKTSLDTFTTRYVAQIFERSLEVLEFLIIHHLEKYSFSQITFHINRFFKALSFLMKPMDDVKDYLSLRLAPNEYDTYDDMVHERLEIRNNLREVTECCFKSLEIIRNVLMHYTLVEQNEKSYNTKVSAYIVRKILPKNMPAYLTIRNISNSRVHFSDKLRNFLVKTYSSISYYYVIFSYDPFWWHLNISELTTDKVLCGIYHEREKITVVPTPFYVTLAMKEKSFSKIEGTVTDASLFNINVHRIILTTRDTISIFFEETSENFHARFSDCYCGPEDMKNAKIIKKDSFERERVLHYETKGDVTFLCIQRLGLTDLNYVGWINVFECMYWDLERGNFQTEGIDVSRLHAHPDDNLVCASFHFSLFLGRAIAPVHQLNTPLVVNFYITFTQNVYVIVLVVVLLCIWLILLYWAISKDREFAKRNVVCKLDDNVPGDKHIYLVVVFTGVFLDAGTTADVAFQLKGEQSESRVHLIKCCDMSLLKRNSQDWFIIYTPKYLGPLKTIRLWHNCEGNEPHWYCQRIIVQHLETGYQYCFIVDDWLSLIWGSGKIYREIQVKHWMEMKKWKVLFSVKVEKLKEEPLWVILIGRQTHNNFNNKERVSTAIAAIFLSMLACAFLFGYPHGVPSDSIDPQTTYFITPDTITIFTESWLISIPVIVVVIFLFKNSAP